MQKYLWGAAALSIAMAAGFYLYVGYVVAHPESILARYSVAAVFSGLNANPLRAIDPAVVTGATPGQGQVEMVKGAETPKPEVCTLEDTTEPFAVEVDTYEHVDGEILPEPEVSEAQPLPSGQVAVHQHDNCSGGACQGQCHASGLPGAVESASHRGPAESCDCAGAACLAEQVGAYLGGWWALYNGRLEESEESGYYDEMGDEMDDEMEDETEDPAEVLEAESIQYHRDHPTCPYTGASCPYCPEYNPPQSRSIDKPIAQQSDATGLLPKKEHTSATCTNCGAGKKVNSECPGHEWTGTSEQYNPRVPK